MKQIIVFLIALGFISCNESQKTTPHFISGKRIEELKKIIREYVVSMHVRPEYKEAIFLHYESISDTAVWLRLISINNERDLNRAYPDLICKIDSCTVFVTTGYGLYPKGFIHAQARTFIEDSAIDHNIYEPVDWRIDIPKNINKPVTVDKMYYILNTWPKVIVPKTPFNPPKIR